MRSDIRRAALNSLSATLPSTLSATLSPTLPSTLAPTLPSTLAPTSGSALESASGSERLYTEDGPRSPAASEGAGGDRPVSGASGETNGPASGDKNGPAAGVENGPTSGEKWPGASDASGLEEAVLEGVRGVAENDVDPRVRRAAVHALALLSPEPPSGLATLSRDVLGTPSRLATLSRVLLVRRLEDSDLQVRFAAKDALQLPWLVERETKEDRHRRHTRTGPERKQGWAAGGIPKKLRT
ncbi:hypothetical protein T484DRAFT_1874826 [Baffinella frigidus]|nr:hypothetical protein T484DRAFT_1874826 [Cryptophyta sp. CCMP2293]